MQVDHKAKKTDTDMILYWKNQKHVSLTLSVNPFAVSTLVSIHLLPPSVFVWALASVTSRWHCSQVVMVYSHLFHLPAPAAKEKSANVFVSP